MYTSKNFKTKKALKEAVAKGERITVYQPNNMFNVQPPENGRVTLEGPHSPQPHKWSAIAELKDGAIVKVS